jgi:predicted secreted hydrolase
MRNFVTGFFLLMIAALSVAADNPRYAEVAPGAKIEFPGDAGSHPNFRTEWWYVTGWIANADRRERGFQITFFRARPDNVDSRNPSRFSPQQILFAHVALSDPNEGKLLHAQRTARAGLGIAEAKENLTHIWIQDWSLQQQGDRYVAKIVAPQFEFDFRFDETVPPMLNGKQGYSQKSPNPLAASYYYSIPQLKVVGSLTHRGKKQAISGTAWLDHEWSSEYMDPRAAGWDWAGINFADGGALMAFRMREHSGKTLWAGATYRDANGFASTFGPEDIFFAPTKHWRSPRTNAIYPVSCRIRVGQREFELLPLLDDQELDSSNTTRAVYWEGAVRASENGSVTGRGYLELTGYAKPLKF